MRNVVIGFALLPERWTDSQKSLLHPEYPNSTLMGAELENSKIMYYALHSDKDDKEPAGRMVDSISSACIFYEEHWKSILQNAIPEPSCSADDRDESINQIIKCDCHSYISVWKCDGLSSENPSLFGKLFPIHILGCDHCRKPVLVFSLDRAMGRKPEVVDN